MSHGTLGSWPDTGTWPLTIVSRCRCVRLNYARSGHVSNCLVALFQDCTVRNERVLHRSNEQVRSSRAQDITRLLFNLEVITKYTFTLVQRDELISLRGYRADVPYDIVLYWPCYPYDHFAAHLDILCLEVRNTKSGRSKDRHTYMHAAGRLVLYQGVVNNCEFRCSSQTSRSRTLVT